MTFLTLNTIPVDCNDHLNQTAKHVSLNHVLIYIQVKQRIFIGHMISVISDKISFGIYIWNHESQQAYKSKRICYVNPVI